VVPLISLGSPLPEGLPRDLLIFHLSVGYTNVAFVLGLSNNHAMLLSFGLAITTRCFYPLAKQQPQFPIFFFGED